MKTEKLFKCLAHQCRLSVLMLLLDNDELSLTELASVLEMSQAMISRQMVLLKKHDLVVERRQELEYYFQVNPKLPIWLEKMLYYAIAAERKTLAPLSERLASVRDKRTRPVAAQV